MGLGDRTAEADVDTYIILTRYSQEAFDDPAEFRDLARRVSRTIRERCPDVDWKESYGTLGRFDVVDIVEADDPADVARAAMIIRGVGRANSTETLVAKEWEEFLDGLG